MTLFKNQKVRGVVLQGLYAAALVMIVVVGTTVTHENLRRQGIISNFDFLWKSTGWEMPFSLLPVTTHDPYWWYLLIGFLNTLFLGVVSLAFATVVGFLVGFARISPSKAMRLMGTIYVEVFRNIPLIVQVFFWYSIANTLPPPRQALHFLGAIISNRGLYLPGFNVAGMNILVFFLIIAAAAVWVLYFVGARRFRKVEPAQRIRVVLASLAAAGVIGTLVLIAGHAAETPFLTVPVLKGLNVAGGYRIQPEVYAIIVAIAIYGGAYIGEIVRGGFKAVGHGQQEAGQSLGLSSWQVFSRVRFPLALRSMLPILANQYVWLMKATTLGIVVGYSDFFMVVVGSITHSGQTLEFIAILMAGFLLINLTLAKIFNTFNKAIALKGHQLRS